MSPACCINSREKPVGDIGHRKTTSECITLQSLNRKSSPYLRSDGAHSTGLQFAVPCK